MDRRHFVKLSALAAGAIAGGSLLPRGGGRAGAETPAVARGPIDDAKVKAMTFDIGYTTQIINPPKNEKRVRFWIPLAQSDQEQEILRLNIDSPVGFQINQETEYGNRMVYVGEADLKGGDRIAVKYRIRRKTSGTVKLEGEDTKKHMVLTKREAWDRDIKLYVEGLVPNGGEPVAIGRRVYDGLVDLLTYDKKIPGCGQGISTWTFANKRGRCDDFHALFRTIMIHEGVPVRWEQGIPLPYPSVLKKSGKLEGDCTGAHCWTRFYIGDENWMPVDISEADKRPDLKDYFFGTLSPNRFKVSTGRNLTLSPPQEGEPLNTFPFTYGEYGDGIPLIYGHHYRNVILYEIKDLEVA